MPSFLSSSIPHITQVKVENTLKQIKTKVSTVPGDIPAKVLKHIAKHISRPMADILNLCIKNGEWPDIWKEESVTPIPKIHPPKEIDNLRNISGLKNLNKIAEKIFAEMMLQDMKDNLDESQFGNQKQISIQHYLVKFVDQILVNLDNNSKGDIFAAIAAVIDWKQAFNRQDPKLGIESFIENGVRASLIPALINYFQGRSMFVKRHNKQSTKRQLNGGGPQGGTFGILEYLSQSNKNANCVENNQKWKWVDDLTILKIINLINIGMASFNARAQVPNDIDIDKNYISSTNLKTQTNINHISNWTEKQKMMLNIKKTNYMVFNFTNNHQFSTRFSINKEHIEEKQNVKLLGTIISSNLKWEENTKLLVKKANARMSLLRAVSRFSPPKSDLKLIYIQYIQSLLEQSCVLWHASLTLEDQDNIERVQKNAFRIILKKITY